MTVAFPQYGPAYDTPIETLADEPDKRHEAGESTESRDWQGALDSGMLGLIRKDRLVEAKEGLPACLSSSSG